MWFRWNKDFSNLLSYFLLHCRKRSRQFVKNILLFHQGKKKFGNDKFFSITQTRLWRLQERRLLNFYCAFCHGSETIYLFTFMSYKHLFSSPWKLKEWMKNVFIYRKKHKVGTKIYYAAAFALIFYVNEQWKISSFFFLTHFCCFSSFVFLFLMTHSHQKGAIFCALFCSIKLFLVSSEAERIFNVVAV